MATQPPTPSVLLVRYPNQDSAPTPVPVPSPSRRVILMPGAPPLIVSPVQSQAIEHLLLLTPENLILHDAAIVLTVQGQQDRSAATSRVFP